MRRPLEAAVLKKVTILALAATLIGLLPTNSQASDGEPDWLQRVNQIRVASGLSPVTENPNAEAGLVAHFAYLQKTDPSLMTGAYASAHTENPASPYYTDAGAQEAARSNLTFDSDSPVGAIDVWLRAPFHAIGILRPGLASVAFARDPSGMAGLDVLGGLSGSEAQTAPVVFPGDGSTINLSSFGGESPDPVDTCRTQHPHADYGAAGLPLIAMLPQAPSAAPQASLVLPNGVTATSAGSDVCVVTAANFQTSDAVYGPSGRAILQGANAVLIIPRVELASGTYHVVLHQDGQPDVAWSFIADIPVPAPPPWYHPRRKPVVKRWGAAHGSATAGAKVTVSRPTTWCHATISYAWTVSGHKVGSSPSLRVQSAWRGRPLTLRVRAKCGRNRSSAKTYNFGTVHG